MDRLGSEIYSTALIYPCFGFISATPHQLHHTTMPPMQNNQSQLHHTTMPPKQNNQPKIQDGKLIEHPIMSLTLGKTVLPHRVHGNPAVLTLSSTSPLSIGSTLTSLSNVTPKLVVGKPSTLSPSSMSSAVSTTPPSSKKSLHTFYTHPTNGLKSSMSTAVKKKLKFSPETNIGAKKQAFLINFCNRDEVKIK